MMCSKWWCSNGGAKVTTAIEASNGIVHVIDAVLKLQQY
jgi:uncharacterized surface protein with fasciclin (FAS1) repeats